MTKFLLIRHGSIGISDYLPGRMPDIHLNKEGEQQALNLSEKLKNENIEKIISSPLERTRRTAEILSSTLNVPVENDDHFLELDFGKWTGKRFDELNKYAEWNLFNTFRSFTRSPQGESMFEAQNRLIKGMENLKIHNAGRIVAVVSHGDPIKLIICYYLGIPIDFLFRFTIDHCSVSVIEINDYGPRLLKLNYV